MADHDQDKEERQKGGRKDAAEPQPEACVLPCPFDRHQHTDGQAEDQGKLPEGVKGLIEKGVGVAHAEKSEEGAQPCAKPDGEQRIPPSCLDGAGTDHNSHDGRGYAEKGQQDRQAKRQEHADHPHRQHRDRREDPAAEIQRAVERTE